MSKLSFQYGFNVFFITAVVLVCSPLMVATANGSGNPRDRTLALYPTNSKGELTEYIPFIQTISSNN
jgi:hypothetical protein